MTNVVPLFPEIEPSTFDQAWAITPTLIRQRCKKLSIVRESWDKHAQIFGQGDLLGSWRTYVGGKDCGGAALDRWLKDGRYEHFAPTAPPPVLNQFHDAMARRAVVGKLGEEFAILYLDRCTQSGTTLIARTQIAVDRMLMHRELFKSLGFTGIRKVRPTDA